MKFNNVLSSHAREVTQEKHIVYQAIKSNFKIVFPQETVRLRWQQYIISFKLKGFHRHSYNEFFLLCQPKRFSRFVNA